MTQTDKQKMTASEIITAAKNGDTKSIIALVSLAAIILMFALVIITNDRPDQPAIYDELRKQQDQLKHIPYTELSAHARVACNAAQNRGYEEAAISGQIRSVNLAVYDIDVAPLYAIYLAAARECSA